MHKFEQVILNCAFQHCHLCILKLTCAFLFWSCALYQNYSPLPHKNANLDKRKAFFFYARKARFYAGFEGCYFFWRVFRSVLQRRFCHNFCFWQKVIVFYAPSAEKMHPPVKSECERLL